MSKEKPSTLFELLDKYSVEIPIIQRDYAQGREDEHAKKVRSNLLRDMKTSVTGGVILDLGFIYGKAEDKDEEKKFIPIDGQQRLTTLFLLYLYAFRNDKSKTELFHKFTYETRITSRDFLKKLIDNRENVFVPEKEPLDEIEDSEWFASSWIHDPTVKAALVMLNGINETFKDVIDLADKLINEVNKPITFKFLDMNELGMEDSLYIKLNARGKPLTNFENFKAQLISRMMKLKLSYTNEFECRFDCEWTDLFWSKYTKDFDNKFYIFFGILLMNHGIIRDDTNWTNNLDYNKIDVDVFNAAFYTLNFLSQKSVLKEVSSFVFDALSDERTYTNRILFYAVSTYLLKTEGVDVGSMWAWLRIIKNLAVNSNIDREENYHNAIESINTLAEHWNDIVVFFADKSKVTGFNQRQIEEEQIKAGIIVANESFAAKIYKAEQHPYFSGQIRSALKLAKNEDGTYNEQQFEYYWEKISALFDADKPKYGNLMRRALLTFGDYTLDVNQFKTLCIDNPNETSRTPSLKALFSNCGNVTRQLLDTIDVNRNIEDQLKQIIDDSNVPGDDWRYCFIKYPQLFNWMSASHLRLRELNGEIHIIRNKWANGYNYHLFLSALYEELLRRKIFAQFDGELGTDVCHCLYASEYIITFNKKAFCVKDKENTIVFKSQSNQPISETADFIDN